MPVMAAVLLVAGFGLLLLGGVIAVRAAWMAGPLRRLWNATVWHPDAIAPDEWDHRHHRRALLPIFDVVMVGAGLWATAYGSPLLNRLFGPGVVDVGGMLLAFVATICLLGVVFPELWKVELLGKALLVFLLAIYAVAVTFFQKNPDPSAGFIAFIIGAALLLPTGRMIELVERWARLRQANRPPKEGDTRE